jgi:hypothetical protein
MNHVFDGGTKQAGGSLLLGRLIAWELLVLALRPPWFYPEVERFFAFTTSISSRRKAMIRLLGTTLILPIVLWLSQPACSQTDQAEKTRGETAREDVPADLSWRVVPQSAKVAVLEFLSGQTRSNYEKIATWTGSYSVHQEEYLSPEFTKGLFEGQHKPTQALIAERDARFRFAIDIKSDSIFREFETTRFRLLTADAARKPAVMPGFEPVDRRSVVTRDDYIYFSYKDPPATLAVVRDHPEAKNKRAARRSPVEKTQNQEHGDLVHPRLFFYCSRSVMSWEELDIYLSWLRGDKGAETKATAENTLQVEEAVREGKSWYRIRLADSSGGSITTWTSIWSPLAGFNPVSMVSLTSFGEKVADPSNRWSVAWRWKEVDGILVPAYVKEVTSQKELRNLNSYLRIVELKECSLNTPIPPDTFTIKALRLEAGDLLEDEVNQTVYLVNQNGKTMELAKYNEPYVPPQERGRLGAKGIVLIGNGALITLALGFLVFRRMRRSTHSQTMPAAG